MYIEDKTTGEAWIGRVTSSKSGKTVYYKGRAFSRTTQHGGANYSDPDSNDPDTHTSDPYWISGPKKNGGDRLFGNQPVHIDDDVRVEYWTDIRQAPDRCQESDASR